MYYFIEMENHLQRDITEKELKTIFVNTYLIFNIAFFSSVSCLESIFLYAFMAK